MGGGGESRRGGLRGPERYLRRPRPVRAGGAAVQDLQPDRERSTTTAPSSSRPSSSPASTSIGQTLGRARCTTCSAASCATRCRSPATCSSATPNQTARGEVRTPEQLVAHAPRAQGSARLHHATSSRAASSRRTTSSSATARSPRRFPDDRLRYDPNARLSVEQAIALRPGDRGPQQRLLRGPDLGPERDAARARASASRSPPTPSSSTSSSSPPTCSTRPSTSSCSTPRSGAASARASRPRASARRSSSASPCTPPASSGSSSRRCCTWAPSCRT